MRQYIYKTVKAQNQRHAQKGLQQFNRKITRTGEGFGFSQRAAEFSKKTKNALRKMMQAYAELHIHEV